MPTGEKLTTCLPACLSVCLSVSLSFSSPSFSSPSVCFSPSLCIDVQNEFGLCCRLKGELKRLEGMSSAKVKPELQQWMVRRKKILAQMAEKEV